MEEVKSLGYKEKPKYEVLASILKTGLKAIHAKDDGTLEFTAPPAPTKVQCTCTCTVHAFHNTGTLLSPLGDIFLVNLSVPESKSFQFQQR